MAIIAFLAVGPLVAVQAPRARIIAAANVTVRQSPSAQSPAIVQLPLGTEVSEAANTDLEKTWVRVVITGGKEGWVMTNLTRPLDGYWKWQTQEQVIADRLARKGDGFAANVELVNFIERIGDSFTDPDGRARIDLHWLKAVQQVLRTIPFNGDKREPYRAWLDRYKSWAVYSEPGGVWMVRNDAIWRVHDTRATTAAADDIAWLTVAVGLPGECEGYFSCYFEWRNRLNGEYLRHYPSGAHAAEAVTAIKQMLAMFSAPSAPPSNYTFVPNDDCAPFLVALDALKAAVDGAKAAPDREATLASLAAFRKRCQ